MTVSGATVLVTGAAGFLGRPVVEGFRREGARVAALVLGPPSPALPEGVEIAVADVAEAAAVEACVARIRPDLVVHLAAVSFPPAVEEDRTRALAVNVAGTFHLLEALARLGKPARFLLASSATVYRPAPRPLVEEDPIGPVSFYGATKAAAEALASSFGPRGFEVVAARLFNVLGAGQAPEFVGPAFARQIAEIEAGMRPAVVEVGNLEARRDFLEAEDAVSALLLLAGRGGATGTYNVCSGSGVRVGELLDRLAKCARRPFEVSVAAERRRKVDVPFLVGSPARLRSLGWSPGVPLEEAAERLLDDWRKRIASPR